MSEIPKDPTDFGPTREGNFDVALFDVDHLIDPAEIEQTAKTLLDSRNVLATPEIKLQERQDNSRTALMEALTASGHLSRIEITGSLKEINAQVLARLISGYDESLPKHELKRRFAEICEELRIQKIHECIEAGLLPADLEVLTVSDYAEFPGNTNIGYRKKNKKGMVRSTALRKNEDGTFTRVIEQVSRSNGTAETSDQLWQESGITLMTGEPKDVCTLNKQAIYSRSVVVNGVVDVQRRLDTFAGPNVRYGDGPDQQKVHLDYEKIREESEARESQIEYYRDKLASYDERLLKARDAGSISQEEYAGQYAQEVLIILRAICTLAPRYAEDCFGKAAAQHYVTASSLAARGDIQGATRVLEAAKILEEPPVYCGMTIDNNKSKELGLKVDDLGQLIKEGKESWAWKKGVCRIDNCPTRPGQTDVGPCDICRNCQHWFERNRDPAKLYKGMGKVVDSVTSKQATVKDKKKVSVWAA